MLINKAGNSFSLFFAPSWILKCLMQEPNIRIFHHRDIIHQPAHTYAYLIIKAPRGKFQFQKIRYFNNLFTHFWMFDRLQFSLLMYTYWVELPQEQSQYHGCRSQLYVPRKIWNHSLWSADQMPVLPTYHGIILKYSWIVGCRKPWFTTILPRVLRKLK